jgi:uracil-DNA glycosylase
MKLKTNKKIRKAVPSTEITSILAKLADRQNAISRLQGNPTASVLLLTPPPTEVEYRQNLPWCGEPAEVFLSFLAQELPEFDRSDVLYLPPIFHGEKPTKETTAESLALFELLIDFPTVEKVLCIGSAPFKVFIGRGTNPNMGTLIGQTIKTTTSRFKPVFVLPDPTPLVMTEGLRGREMFIQRREAGNMSLKLMSLVPALTKFLS